MKSVGSLNNAQTLSCRILLSPKVFSKVLFCIYLSFKQICEDCSVVVNNCVTNIMNLIQFILLNFTFCCRDTRLLMVF